MSELPLMVTLTFFMDEKFMFSFVNKNKTHIFVSENISLTLINI